MPEKRLTVNQFARKLRKLFPTDKPVKVRICQMPYSDNLVPKKREYGDCDDKITHFQIRLSKDESESTQKDVLMHEWAHALTGWNNEHPTHSNKWGIQYARIYREMVGD